MLLRNNAVALALITIISSSNATQPGSVAASDARVKSSALVAHCLKTNPGLEDSAKSGGFMEGELDELMNRGKIIARLESRPQTRGTQIILRDARGEVQELMNKANGFNPETGRTTYSQERLTSAQVVDRLNRILKPKGTQC